MPRTHTHTVQVHRRAQEQEHTRAPHRANWWKLWQVSAKRACEALSRCLSTMSHTWSGNSAGTLLGSIVVGTGSNASLCISVRYMCVAAYVSINQRLRRICEYQSEAEARAHM